MYNNINFIFNLFLSLIFIEFYYNIITISSFSLLIFFN